MCLVLAVVCLLSLVAAAPDVPSREGFNPQDFNAIMDLYNVRTRVWRALSLPWRYGLAGSRHAFSHELRILRWICWLQVTGGFSGGWGNSTGWDTEVRGCCALPPTHSSRADCLRGPWFGGTCACAQASPCLWYGIVCDDSGTRVSQMCARPRARCAPHAFTRTTGGSSKSITRWVAPRP